uniref:LacI family transcriptional regulator n=1 Tax=Acidobacterium capsulatum TaxID=33075 RepID=A0A7V4XUJ9_9BACT
MKKGEATPNQPATINLKQLSELLQLSQTTISLVLNHSPNAKSIPAHTRERIREAAIKYQYRPNYFARSLRRSRSMSIGVVVPDMSDGYFTLLMHSVERYLIKANYFYFMASHFRDQELTEEYVRMLLERAVDGLLLLDTPARIETTVPVVAISAHSPAPGATNIFLDHDKAGAEALQHLRDLGHERIAFMRGPENISDAHYRWHGIAQAAESLGITIHPELVITLEELDQTPSHGYKAMRKLLRETRDFTAIFCFNDICAFGAIRAIDDAGLSVPGDISVIGFDDIASAAYHQPSLTTVQQPLREMGARGAKILLDRINHPSRTYPAEIVMEPKLIVRESTGPAKARTAKAAKKKSLAAIEEA